MANTFLWVGKDRAYPTPSVSTPQQRLDKYCFNGAGNWRQKINNRWVSTSTVPTAGDTVIFGGERVGIGATQGAGELPGWIPAACPCYYGGYSGGVGLGTWSHTSPGGTGTTWTNALDTVIINVSPYTFAPGDTIFSYGYGWSTIGGGITGNNLISAVLSENAAAAAGFTIDESFFTAANSAGFRDPNQGLQLKVKNLIQITDPYQKLASSHPDDITGSNSTYDLAAYRFQPVIDFVKAYTGGTGSSSVATKLVFNGGRGSSMRIRNGTFDTITINKEITFEQHSIGFTATSNSLAPIWNNYGLSNWTSALPIYVENAIIKDLIVGKAAPTYIVGCTLAALTAYQYPYGITAGSDNILRQTNDVPLHIQSEFSATQVYSDAYGITLSSQIPANYNNILTLAYHDIGAVVSSTGQILRDSVSTPEERVRGLRNGGISSSILYPNQRLIGQYVWLESKTDTVTGVVTRATRTIPTVIINGAIDAPSLNSSSTNYHYSPWVLVLDEGTIINKLYNNAGYVYSGPNMTNEPLANIKIGECHLSNNGTVDFSMFQTNFDDWRFGGLSGDFVSGGIIGDDETGWIVGSPNMRLWNTQINSGINARSSSAKVADTFTPTISTK